MPVGMIMLFALVASLFVFPVRTWLHQRNLLAERQAEYAAYEDIVENLQDQVNYLQSPAGLRDAIRTQLGYLAPDEKRVPLDGGPGTVGDLPRALALHDRVHDDAGAHVAGNRRRRAEPDFADPTSALVTPIGSLIRRRRKGPPWREASWAIAYCARKTPSS